jgi:hypothetical protein
VKAAKAFFPRYSRCKCALTRWRVDLLFPRRIRKHVIVRF